MPRSHLKDAARRRAERTGGSYQKALQALTRFDRPRPEQQHNLAGVDWSPLYGVEVTFANEHHRLRGVVLPPDGVRPGDDWLRVAVTGPHTGIGPAEVTYLDARRWQIDPMPDKVDQRFLPSKRLTRGARGLPLYRSDNLPAAALATKTMLERQYRMRPATGQEPLAEYYATRDYYDLYALDDAERLPEQSPARKATWRKIRTCARCGKQQNTPYSKAGDDKRYCQPCWPYAADEWWTSNMERAQDLATEWAREIIGDANAVITACAGWPFTRLVVLDVVSGAVVHDLTAMLAEHDPTDFVGAWRIQDDDPRWAECTPLPQVAEILTSLAGRRIISWSNGLKPVTQRLINSGQLRSPKESGLDPSTWDHTSRDSAWNWYGYWLSEPEHEQRPGKVRWSGGWNQVLILRCLHRAVRETASSGENLLEQCISDLAVLRMMAAGPSTQEHHDQSRDQPARSAEMYVYSSTLTELVADGLIRKRMRYTGETYKQSAAGIRESVDDHRR